MTIGIGAHVHWLYKIMSDLYIATKPAAQESEREGEMLHHVFVLFVFFTLQLQWTSGIIPHGRLMTLVQKCV